ncbi:MAG: ABC transporter ATP-binding protein [Egibacteraceae bacterium]
MKTLTRESRGWEPGQADLGPEGARGLRGMLVILRSYLAPFSVSVACGVANQGLAVATNTLGAYLVASAIVGRPVERLWPLVAVLAVLVLARAGAAYLEIWIPHEMAFRLLAEVRYWLYWAFERLAPGRLAHRRSGDLVARAMTDSEGMEMFYAHTLIYVSTAIVLTPILVVALAVVHPLLALALLPMLALACSAPFLLRRANARHGRALRERVAEVNADVVDAVQGLREVVAFGQGPGRLELIRRRSTELAHAQMVQGARAGSETALTTTLVSLGTLVVALVGANLVIDGRLELVMFPVAVVLGLGCFQPAITLFNATKVWGITYASADRVFAILDQPAPVPDAGTSAPVDVEPAVRFDGVSFRYHPDGPWAVRDASFEIAPGETVALVGHSGAGKSTLAHLLLRFWDPASGAVRIGGHDLRDLTQERLYELVAFVPQDVFLFHNSVSWNIALGRPESTDAEIRRCVAAAQAADFIAGLPEGGDTMVGERGARLSGGERQRVAIARALLRDAPILVLDESVSMLDAISERDLQRAVAEVRAGRTALVIAHRLSTILAADRIVVLEQGHVVGTGTHPDLLATCPAYSRLVDAQWSPAP